MEYPSEDGPGREMFLCSEDWSEATDRLNPTVANLIVTSLADELQLPRFYARICGLLISHPRRMFDQTGKKELGMKKLGIFQGDPLVKSVLHLSHVISREISEIYVKEVCNSVFHGFPVKKWDNKTYRPFPVLLMGDEEEKREVFRKTLRNDTIRGNNLESAEQARQRLLMQDLTAFRKVQ